MPVLREGVPNDCELPKEREPGAVLGKVAPND